MSMFRSTTDEMLATRFDPKPYVTHGGRRASQPESPFLAWGFDPRPEFIPSRYADEIQELRDDIGDNPHPDDFVLERETLAEFVAYRRPEPNPILVAFREEARLQREGDGFDIPTQAQLWIARNEGADDATPAQIEHATKVLARLVALGS